LHQNGTQQVGESRGHGVEPPSTMMGRRGVMWSTMAALGLRRAAL
jgi:hypothetical protein